MKKITVSVLAVLMSIMMVSATAANPFDSNDYVIQSMIENTSDDGTKEEDTPESFSEEGSGDMAAGQTVEEPDGSGIPKDEPVSTTGDLYGYKGTFDLENASSEQVKLDNGEWEINDAQVIFWGGSVISNNGTSSLDVHNSYIRGETAVETAPLTGNPGNLLVAGNIRTTLGMGNSQSYYINSTICTRNWAALSTDGAVPALEEGEKELGLYVYGSEAVAIDGGYGGYSDLFCNLYVYGSHIQSAELGIISGTYGKVTIGTIEDGEADEELAAILTKADKKRWDDKKTGSVIEGGRNAVMIHSVNLPPYWEYEGYSQEEIPLLSAEISAKGSILRTDLDLDKHVEYEEQKQAYIDHTAGTVILIKSTNADIKLEDCEIVPDEDGTGYLIQTVFNNDSMFMNAVPDGEDYPGIKVSMHDMEVAGGIAHEDYQRDMELILAETALEGAVNEYDFSHWDKVSAEEGFPDFCLDESYETHHGVSVTLQESSVWKVTEESHLSRLEIGDDCKVKGIITVDGTEKENVPGTTYEGKVVVMPGGPEEDETEEETAAEEETTTEKETTAHIHDWQVYSSVPAGCTWDGEIVYICSGCGETTSEIVPATGHNYQRDGGYPATCTVEGAYGWTCFDCGDSYLEPIPAMGHDWQVNNTVYPTCTESGYTVYECTRCAAVVTDDYVPATGHDFGYSYTVDATCMTAGYDVYFCNTCGEEEWFNFIDAYGPYGDYGHNYVFNGSFDDVYHYYECTLCGHILPEIHSFTDPCWCGHSGPVG